MTAGRAAVSEVAQCLHGTAVGGAERDTGPATTPSAENFDVIPCNQAAHAVRDENYLGVGGICESPPFREAPLNKIAEPLGGNPVIEAPVVREFEEIAACFFLY